MPYIYLKKTGDNLLAAADENALNVIRRMRLGQAMKLKYSFPRNYGNHKRFFAFLNTAFQIQDHFDNFKHFRKWLTMRAGHWEIIQAPNGYQIFDAKSIAFDKLDEKEFQEIFESCIDEFIKYWGDRITRDQLESVIEFV